MLDDVSPGGTAVSSVAVSYTHLREVPQFDTSGDASNYTTTVGPVSGTTEISPFETTITDPLPEHELERGVHDQQKIWTPVSYTHLDVYKRQGRERRSFARPGDGRGAGAGNQ